MIAIHSTGGDVLNVQIDYSILQRAMRAITDEPTAACLDWVVSADDVNRFALEYLNSGPEGQSLLSSGGPGVPATLGARIRSAATRVASSAEYPAEGVMAINDAAKYADRYFSDLQPTIFASSDGTVMLQWPSNTNGVALVFIGDGTVVISKRDAWSGYARNGVEYSIEAAPPAEVMHRVRGIQV